MSAYIGAKRNLFGTTTVLDVKMKIFSVFKLYYFIEKASFHSFYL